MSGIDNPFDGPEGPPEVVVPAPEPRRRLRTADVHTEGDTPHVVVRYGRPPARPTKTGKVRRVPLFGLALDAARRQVARAPGAVFWPAPRGGFRSRYRVLGRVHLSDGRYADVWPSVVLEAGIGRPVRWHDLRHTCASACVSGWWGRRWTIEEVAALLGHATTTTTQRYAHLGESALAQAARETAGPAGHALATAPRRGARSGLKLAPPVRLERTAFGLGLTDGTEWACNGEGEGVFSRAKDGSWRQHTGTGQAGPFRTAAAFSRHVHATYRSNDGERLPRMRSSRGWS